MKILGVDPGGASGALAKLEVSPSSVALFDVTDVPLIGSDVKQRVDVVALQEWLLQHKLDLAFSSQAMPKQGASSGFKYGRTTGAIEAVITVCGIPLEIIEPSMWKKCFAFAAGTKRLHANAPLNFFAEHMPRSPARKTTAALRRCLSRSTD